MEIYSETPPSPNSKIHQTFEDTKFTADDVTKADMKIISAFSDVVHQNYGNCIDGGIEYGKE